MGGGVPDVEFKEALGRIEDELEQNQKHQNKLWRGQGAAWARRVSVSGI